MNVTIIPSFCGRKQYFQASFRSFKAVPGILCYQSMSTLGMSCINASCFAHEYFVDYYLSRRKYLLINSLCFWTWPSLRKVIMTEHVCLITADVLIIIVTIYHTYETVKASRETNIHATFSSTLLCAGIVHSHVWQRNMSMLISARYIIFWVRPSGTVYMLFQCRI